MAHVFDGRCGKLLGKREVGACLQRVVERAGVYADTNGNMGGASGFDDFVGLFPTANIARVDAQLRRAAASSFDGDTRIEMHVGDHRQGAFRAHLGKLVKISATRNGRAHHFAAGRLKRANLTQVRLHVVGGSVEHRLHDARGAAAHGNSTHVHATRALIRTQRGDIARRDCGPGRNGSVDASGSRRGSRSGQSSRQCVRRRSGIGRCRIDLRINAGHIRFTSLHISPFGRA